MVESGCRYWYNLFFQRSPITTINVFNPLLIFFFFFSWEEQFMHVCVKITCCTEEQPTERFGITRKSGKAEKTEKRDL